MPSALLEIALAQTWILEYFPGFNAVWPTGDLKDMTVSCKVHIQRNLASKQIREPDTFLPCHDVSCGKIATVDQTNCWCCADLRSTISHQLGWEQSWSGDLSARVSDYQRSSNGNRHSRIPRQGKNTRSYGDAMEMLIEWNWSGSC